jgi:succinate dehydrogenase flavin-adding protein (antitoxin of CptAB toxin-antitoxin module)
MIAAMQDTQDVLKRKLRYQCQYRGTRELDVILRKFIADGTDAHISDWVLFEQFLSEPEPVLADWLINDGGVVPCEYQVFVDLIKCRHAK